ncbi:hypothetical protein H2200_010669 [Cladophialophora chaetospira]|uniref:Uncharacterized protein n=1 Tax=Cladophialophora chaetospira TaxID=386627 RepID=A0AA38X0J5_9EURO|nr:hypothetical protein H2200_010669 [Cladophialophora chaetospira]
MPRSLTLADKLTYILTVLQNTALAKPDYHKAALQLGMPNAKVVQNKYRAVLRSVGFDLVRDQIVEDVQGAGGDNDIATPPVPANTDHGRGRKARGDGRRKGGGDGDTRAGEKENMSTSTTKSPEQTETSEPPKKKRRLNNEDWLSASTTVDNEDVPIKVEEDEIVDYPTTAQKNNAERGFIVLANDGSIKYCSYPTQTQPEHTDQTSIGSEDFHRD